MKPYLKGIHQTLDSWRKGRDKDGWKLSRRELLAVIEDKEGDYDPVMDKDAPSRVKPVSRLRNDLTALTTWALEGMPWSVVREVL